MAYSFHGLLEVTQPLFVFPQRDQLGVQRQFGMAQIPDPTPQAVNTFFLAMDGIPDDTACTLEEWNAKIDKLLASCQLEESAL